MPDTEKLDTSLPFSRAAGIAAGLKQSTLRGPGFIRPFTGVYVAASSAPTPLRRVRAALVPFGGRAFASHASAARVYKLPIPTLPDEHVTVLDARHRRAHPGIICHVVARAETLVIGGIPVSMPEQLFVELAGLLILVDLVVVGDHLVRQRWSTPERLRAYAETARLPGARAARRAVAYVRSRVKSPMESRLRMLLVLAGLPEPGINVLVGSENGTKREHDLLYLASKTAIDYDGREHVEVVQQWEADLQRREDADDDDWRLVIVVAKGIYRQPEATLLKVQRILIERGEPDVPRTLLDAWRPYFPGLG